MSNKKNYVEFPKGDCYGIDDIFVGFDHSFGPFSGGGLFCWPNRYGKKTFANSNRDGKLDLLVICKETEVKIYDGWELLIKCDEEHVLDGKPHFQSPSIEDLVPFVTRLKFEPEDRRVIHTDAGYLISKFLVPGIECAASDYGILELCQWSLPSEFIKFAKEMPYGDFLQTPYWRFVSQKMKNGGKCEICGSTKNLEVHHTTYDFRGDELLHMDSLKVLCHDCHSKTHNKEK